MVERSSSQSYITDVEYPVGFSANQAPAHLCYIGCLNGVAGPDQGGFYRYCELGCGAGHTLNVLAAANPDAEFLGIDLNPQHVARAYSQAEDGKLTNVSFLTADIAGDNFEELQDFDFITLHGLYSWVTAEVRQSILSFIDAKLRPGGLIFVSYNNLPGWATIGQLRRYFLERSAHLAGNPTDMVQAILDELENLHQQEVPFFTDNPAAAQVLATIRKQNPRYVVHEFLSPGWQAMAFVDVNRDMEGIGLSFVGNAQIIHNLLEYAVPEASLDLLKGLPDRRCQESIKDLINNSYFRGDVYVRGPAARGHESADALLLKTVFGMEKTPRELSQKVPVFGGQIKIEGSCVAKLKDLLASAATPLAEILDHPDLKDCPKAELTNAIKLLSTSRQIMPFARRGAVSLDRPPDRIRFVPPLNRVLSGQTESRTMVLASPVAGTGISIAWLEACLLHGLETEDPVSVALAEIHRRGIEIKQGDEPIVGDAAQRKAVAGVLPEFKSNKLPSLIALGVVEPWHG